MGKVRILPENIANKIAAGEVVERPASVVKELMENSLDAESTDITVEVRVGGKELIRVIDNGIGMAYDDAILALERHATSKIQSVQDLGYITTMGFRGEALPSIASVSRLELITRTCEAMEGTKIKVEGGVTRDVERIGSPIGTRISVANIFYNMPARRKFLKATSTELNHIIRHVTWAGLAHPRVSFKLLHNNNTIIEARRCNTTMERIHLLYGRDFAENIVSFDWEFETIKLQAFIGKPEFTRSSREHQLFFLNRRPIRSRLLGAALGEAFGSVIPKGRYPVAILFLEIEPRRVDVNVHPAKTEVRFRDERSVYKDVTRGLLMGMRQHEYMPEIHTSTAEMPSPMETERRKATPSDPGHPRKAEIEASVLGYLSKQSSKPKSVLYPPESPSGKKTGEFPRRIERQPARQRPMETIALPLMDLENIQIKTRLFNTYIVAETAEEVLFIDQHIAEERVIYEKLKSQMEQQGVPSQGLLLPITVELSPAQAAVLDSALEILTSMGFALEPFGGRTIVVRAVPSVMQRGDIKQAVMDLMDQIAASPDKHDRPKLREDALITTACHSAVKAGDELTDAEVMNLLKELFSTEPPFVCPHGRPIVIRMSRSELEEKFQRK
jgi:DNA mismatch repair protein MutL